MSWLLHKTVDDFLNKLTKLFEDGSTLIPAKIETDLKDFIKKHVKKENKIHGDLKDMEEAIVEYDGAILNIDKLSNLKGCKIGDVCDQLLTMKVSLNRIKKIIRKIHGMIEKQ